jgi:hypothetical protein
MVIVKKRFTKADLSMVTLDIFGTTKFGAQREK